MKILSIDLRRRIVESYESGKTRTYKETARVFGVGEATVSRLIRKKKETGDVIPGKRGGGPQRKIDLEWLTENAEQYPG
ncbi:helix-turn-helix domain-containing protein [Myxococcota bacterium]|nr:helix-turn-helix domain-containing protein [Myxococcota bacterium]MBU1380440.1 helix-turn-helix domain-containing protein [Myxococcota bacterium]MBU1495929.1 helix-turn-helix domain-containing protein [Myxococcota bacterium]